LLKSAAIWPQCFDSLTRTWSVVLGQLSLLSLQVCRLGAGVCTCCDDVTRDVTSDDQSYSPTHNHLQLEGHADLGQGHDLGQGEVEGHEDEFGDDGENVELKVVIRGIQTIIT